MNAREGTTLGGEQGLSGKFPARIGEEEPRYWGKNPFITSSFLVGVIAE